jgi:signal transduction histidine kinase
VGRSAVSAWLLAALAGVLAALSWTLSALAGEHGDPWWQSALATAVVFAAVAVGLLIAVRRRGHPIGWLLLVHAVLLAVANLSQSYASYALLEEPGALPGARWAVLWDQTGWPLLFGIVIAIVLVFPDGRLPSPRWRRVAIAVAASFGLFVLLGLLDPEPFEAPYENLDRPLPALPEAFLLLWPLVLLGMLGSLIAGVQAVRLRFRRARGVERLQLKWLAYTALLVPATLLVCAAGALTTGGVEQKDAFNALFFLMLGAIPASIGIAVVRYRLYDIDRLINRTLVYGVLSIMLAAAYTLTTLALGTAIGSGSAWPTAAATLLVAVAFRPLRAYVQTAVDRRFSRARYDARRRIAAFLEELRAGRAAPEDVEPLLREVVGDPGLELLFFLPESELYVDASGRPAPEAEADGRCVTPVTRAGVPLGMVIHEPIDAERPRLLEEVVEAAGLAMEITRLRVELRRQLAEVQASRARLVSAGYEERKRIERDLHDGAQQRLVSIGLALRHAQHELDLSPAAAGKALDGAVGEITVAIDELRELARGIRPSQLDHGLAPALKELAARVPLPVKVKATRERFDPELEAAAYFIASESLTNAVKHAQAGRVSLTAQRLDGKLVVCVADDGVGGAAASGGTGLRGLNDRVAAHGGRLEIHSAPARGTTIVAELPCES